MTALSLGAARKHLNISGIEHDDELQDTIAAAEGILAHYVGPLEPTTYTERLTGSDVVALTHSPVISLTSVTNYAGTTLTVGDFYIDADAGLVSYLSTGRTFGSQPYTVVYQAGWTTVPGDLLQAVKELTRHLWESQRGAPPRFPGSEEPVNTSATAYLLPYRVQELIAPYVRIPVS